MATKKSKNSNKPAIKKPAAVPSAPSLAAHDWGSAKLTDKQRLFVHYYTWPGQDGFHCASRAAQYAGYTKRTAESIVYKMLREPKIQELVQKFEEAAKSSVHDAAQRFIQEKITRADYNVKDFFDIEVGVDEKTGKPWRAFLPKSPEKLTPEQLLCIENMQTSQGATNIVFANRQKERDDIIALDKMWNGGRNGEGQDLEEIREVIIERVVMRHEKRLKMAEVSTVETSSEIIDKSENEDGEEL